MQLFIGFLFLRCKVMDSFVESKRNESFFSDKVLFYQHNRVSRPCCELLIVIVGIQSAFYKVLHENIDKPEVKQEYP